MEEILLRLSLGAVFGIISLIVGVAIKGYFNGLGKRISEVATELQSLKETLPKEYVLKDDHDKDIKELKDAIKELRKEIREGFRRIEEKLDRKVDK